MKKPMIGVLGRYKMNSSDEVIIPEDIRYSLIQSGAIPILILSTNRKLMGEVKPFTNDLSDFEKEDLKQVIELCDGILFPGGSMWFSFDQFVYEYALSLHKPMLGICLGMQMMANSPFFQINLSDKTVLISSKIQHQSKEEYVHEVQLKESKLKNILKKECILVNSRHSYQINDSKDFLISSESLDGVMESIELPREKFVIGVQWHPETTFKTDENSQKIFLEFVNHCKK